MWVCSGWCPCLEGFLPFTKTNVQIPIPSDIHAPINNKFINVSGPWNSLNWWSIFLHLLSCSKLIDVNTATSIFLLPVNVKLLNMLVRSAKKTPLLKHIQKYLTRKLRILSCKESIHYINPLGYYRNLDQDYVSGPWSSLNWQAIFLHLLSCSKLIDVNTAMFLFLLPLNVKLLIMFVRRLTAGSNSIRYFVGYFSDPILKTYENPKLGFNI